MRSEAQDAHAFLCAKCSRITPKADAVHYECQIINCCQLLSHLFAVFNNSERLISSNGRIVCAYDVYIL